MPVSNGSGGIPPRPPFLLPHGPAVLGGLLVTTGLLSLDARRRLRAGRSQEGDAG